MNEVQYIFFEAISKGWLSDTVAIVRKGGKVFDFVLPGEVIRPHEIVTEEVLSDVMAEISTY